MVLPPPEASTLMDTPEETGYRPQRPCGNQEDGQ